MTALLDAALRRIDQAERQLRLLVQNVAYLTTVARSSATGEADAAHAPDRDEKGRIPFRRVGPFGFHSVPPEGTLVAIIKALAGKAAGIGVGFSASRHAPSDLETGESAVYSSANPKAVHADKDGNTRIKSTGSANVVINDGTKSVIRVDDEGDGGHLIFIPNVGASPASLSYLAPGVPLPAPLPAGATAIAIKVKFSSGAPHLKA